MSELQVPLQKNDWSLDLQASLLEFIKNNVNLISSYSPKMSDQDILNLFSSENYPEENRTVILFQGTPFIVLRYSFKYDGNSLRCTCSIDLNKFWKNKDEKMENKG